MKVIPALPIHTTTNDRDVNVIEVEHLIAQLNSAGSISVFSQVSPDEIIALASAAME